MPNETADALTNGRDPVLAAHPFDIYLACDHVFEEDAWLSWDQETLLLELRADVSDAAVDKLLAVQAVAANSGAVLGSALAFEKVVNAFSNNICVMDVLQPPEVEEMCYAVTQIEKIFHAVHGAQDCVFTSEVPGYVASVARFRDWTVLPKNLAFAQEALDKLTGLQKDSRLRKEHADILSVITEFAENTGKADAESFLADESIKMLETDTEATLLVRRLIGALLYDPTIPYTHNTDATGSD